MSTADSKLPEDQSGKGQMPSLIHNRLSLIGLGIAGYIFANLLFLVFLSLSGVQNPYLGILAYLIFPLVALFALLLIPLGMLRERRRRRTFEPSIPRYPRLDLNVSGGKQALAIIAVSFVLFVCASATATYKAYHFTDTVTFCGPTCHTVMKPEYTAYQDSPHARVRCVDCHVGPGAAWYVRSKLSGVYQVYAVLFHKYPRPITTPIKDLRPVRQACEQCHWPQKFYGAQLKIFTHFAYDENNTPTQIQMLIKTGGGGAKLGRAAGIHWHMNIANQVWFRVTDRQHQDIPWVRVRAADGRITTYTERGAKLDAKQLATTPIHLMDCVTCHDRPAHRFRPPDAAVDDAFVAEKLDPSLPYLKKEAVAALTKPYPSTEAAIEGIATMLNDFYQAKYPQVYADKQMQLQQAIATVQLIYRNNMFPYMKADWRIHPDNIGHLYYKGCFRCHDGKHVSPEGRIISEDCNICHVILSETTSGQRMPSPPSEPFRHPIDLRALKDVPCDSCHSGGGMG
jgi:NapC/NirT cytochrome c family, N-terminal region